MNGANPRWVISKPKDRDSVLDIAPPPALLGSKISGYLYKQGEKGLVKAWKKRWFVFDKEDGKLCYHLNETEKPLGVIDLFQCEIHSSPANRKEFAIHYLTTGRMYLLQAVTETDATFWVTLLEEWKTTITSLMNNAAPASKLGSRSLTITLTDRSSRESTAIPPTAIPPTPTATPTEKDKDIKELVKKLTAEPQDLASVRKTLQYFPRPYTSADIHSLCLQLATHMEYLQTCITEVANLPVSSEQQVLGEDSYNQPSELEESYNSDSDYVEEGIAGSFLFLPAGLIYYIFSFLQPEDLARSGQVCHTWQTYADNPALWAHFVSVPASKYDPLRNWKNVYISTRIVKAKKDVRQVSVYGLPQVVGTAKEGWLYKRGEDLLKIWKRRWFVIKDNCLYYFKTPKDTLPFGVIPLTNLAITVVKGAGRKHCFKLASVSSEMNAFKQAFVDIADKGVAGQGMTESQRMECLLAGESEEECLSWITELRNNILIIMRVL